MEIKPCEKPVSAGSAFSDFRVKAIEEMFMIKGSKILIFMIRESLLAAIY